MYSVTVATDIAFLFYICCWFYSNNNHVVSIKNTFKTKAKDSTLTRARDPVCHSSMFEYHVAVSKWTPSEAATEMATMAAT